MSFQGLNSKEINVDTDQIYYSYLNNFLFKSVSDWSHIATFAIQSCNVATSEPRFKIFFIWLINVFYLFLFISLSVFLIPNADSNYLN